MVMWRRLDTQCPVVALRVHRGEGWFNFGMNVLSGGCLAGGSNAVIDVLYVSWVKMSSVLN